MLTLSSRIARRDRGRPRPDDRRPARLNWLEAVMTTDDRPCLLLGLDADDRRVLAAVAEWGAALRPFLRPALVVRLQLAALLLAYLLTALAIAAGLLCLFGRF